MVDLRGVQDLRLATRQADPDGARAHLRQGVVDRLLDAQARLPAGLALLIVEGYRPISLQTRFFDEHLAELAELHPDLSTVQLHARAALHVAPPHAAAHCTGGAVDLTLCDAVAGDEVDLGSAINATPDASDGRCFTACGGLSAQGAVNRAALVAALSSAGFINYPAEWWHWSWGDRYWAHASGAPVARYGPAAAPPGGLPPAI